MAGSQRGCSQEKCSKALLSGLPLLCELHTMASAPFLSLATYFYPSKSTLISCMKSTEKYILVVKIAIFLLKNEQLMGTMKV